ncbi:Glycosyl hydrolase [Sphingomonas sp. EC-HK361]|uniref:glycoside hydrolase family 25 protein n=1 Tax=Sphingomonas sp. EC-HK361 TaxID=2038397 RepID=UPI0012511654|nr:GH25 family lysozyme [Sphingomonas sp. EC-HK361]VVT21292.1 Glycosyl hydrolase [Sphingomonas sp. EC-HK361]
MWRILAVLAAAGIVAMAAWQVAIGWRPSSETYPVQGVDVSEANGAVEWPLVKGSGADFAYIVATAGARHRDSRFETNWSDSAAAGLRRGAIHVYSLCEDAVDQANAFNTVVPRAPGALPPAVEIAYDPGCADRPQPAAFVADLKRFLTIVETHTGKPALLLISRAVDRDYDLSSALPRGVWAMGNGLKPGYPAHGWRMWRASDFRRIEGIDGPVNWDVVKMETAQ